VSQFTAPQPLLLFPNGQSNNLHSPRILLFNLLYKTKPPSTTACLTVPSHRTAINPTSICSYYPLIPSHIQQQTHPTHEIVCSTACSVTVVILSGISFLVFLFGGHVIKANTVLLLFSEYRCEEVTRFSRGSERSRGVLLLISVVF
jgi:hypothetical protein